MGLVHSLEIKRINGNSVDLELDGTKHTTLRQGDKLILDSIPKIERGIITQQLANKLLQKTEIDYENKYECQFTSKEKRSYSKT